ncbi:MAG: response regulator transcription factor [Candidatus Gracilibacteria bacterium]|nr:response regulator transcription factor [Candidatus Gracilibacteria bacterium]
MLIAILEDEDLLAKNTAKKLEKYGYTVNVFNDILSIKTDNNLLKYDLYIVDITLPDGNGLEFIKWLRDNKRTNSPIIITSAYNDIDKKVYGLSLGADDYLAKPFSPDELIARVSALIRRSYTTYDTPILKYKDFYYDKENKTLKKGTKEIDLNKKELDIVELFLDNKGKLITKAKITSSIRGDYENLLVSDNTINVTISRIRAKLGDSFNLKTLIGKGYKLEK